MSQQAAGLPDTKPPTEGGFMPSRVHRRCLPAFRSLSVALVACAPPLLLAAFEGSAAAVPRIVCIGEQTTQTTEMSPTWPTKMQTDLGAAYTVTNDGDGSATV